MPRPACHVFTAGNTQYAYDLNTQELLSADPALAAELREPGAGTAEARDALQEAQDQGFFTACWPKMTARPPAGAVDQGLQHLVLTVTEVCNLRCAYCLHGADLGWVRTHGTEMMSVDTALAAVTYYLDRCDPDRDPVISFYGGEALLNLEVVKAVIAAARRHPRGSDTEFVIDTNGVFLLDDIVIDLVVRERVRLQISIDGPAASHDRHRVDTAGGPTFDRIMSNIGRLLDRDPGADERLSYVLTLAPPVDLFAAADLFAAFPPYKTRGITEPPNVRVNFANLHGQDWATGQEAAAGLPTAAEQIDQAREKYLAAFAAGELDGLSPVIRALFDPDIIRWHHRKRVPLAATYSPGGNCRPGRRKLHVGPDGVLHPCERTGDVMPIGSLESGLDAGKVQALDTQFHAAVGSRCADCWAMRMCSVCYAGQAEGRGEVLERICNQVRAQKESMLRLMVEILAMPVGAREWLKETEIS